MAISPRSVLLVVAVILFILAAAVPPPSSRIALTPAGLAFLAAGFLFP